MSTINELIQQKKELEEKLNKINEEIKNKRMQDDPFQRCIDHINQEHNGYFKFGTPCYRIIKRKMLDINIIREYDCFICCACGKEFSIYNISKEN